MKQLLLVVFISIFALACSKDDSSSSPTDPKPSAQPNVLEPLAVGNLWYYDAYYIHSAHPNDTSQYFEGYTQVQARIKVDNEYWYYCYDCDSHFYVTNRKDGYYQIDNDFSETYLLFNYPTTMGDITNRKDLNAVTRGIDVKIKVPAGEFSCIMYELTDKENNKAYCYYAPKVGMVYFTHIKEIKGEGAFRDTTWSHKVLTKYELK